MHRLRAWGLSTALAAGTAAPVGFAADPAPISGPLAETKPWYSRMFGGGKPPAPTKVEEAAPRSVPTGPLSPETMTEALRSEQDAYLRRLDVCTRLRQVAIENNDDKLLERADGLEQQATALYHQRTARLGVRGGPKGSYIPPTATVTASTRKPVESLDRKLGTGAATDPIASIKPTTDDAKPATAQIRGWKVVPE